MLLFCRLIDDTDKEGEAVVAGDREQEGPVGDKIHFFSSETK